MCGIAAVYDQANDSDPHHTGAAGVEMLSRIAHRGPDDSDHWRIGRHAWLGHTRLSIVDLEGGRQPLGDPDGWALVCNGEIYNHAGIRERLDGATDFSTASDSESALALLRLHGPRALDRLQGMWALCAATPDGAFVAARDRLGIKPLYWAREDGDGRGRIWFASEIRAFPVAVQPAVEAFPPGHYWTPGGGLVRFAGPVSRTTGRDWEDVAPEIAEKATREVLVDSVRRHLMADVEVGVFLSGGLDSSLVAAVAAADYAAAGKRLKTFAVGTEGSPDLLAARDAAAFLGTEHHEAVFDAALADAVLERVVAAVESYDASLIRSAVPNWFLAELASRHVKAVLTGEGADELFAGYGYYHSAHADPAALDRELERTLADLHGLNLQRCDRVTMAHGLEARVPFLDAQVIGHAMALPPELKGLEPDGPRKGTEKGHLRRAFAGWLPEHLLWRRKVQFGTGSGARDVLGGERWEREIGDAELAAAGDGVRTKEELAYYRAFRAALPAVRPEAVLTRFATA